MTQLMAERMTKRLVIIGAGGHGKVAADCAESMAVYDDIVFLDAGFSERPQVGPWKIIGLPEDFNQYTDCEFFVAIGDNHGRQRWLLQLLAAQVSIASLVHSSAVVSKHSSFGEGSLICANAVVNPFTSLGFGCILNTGATIDHDCNVGDMVHIAPGSHVAGGVNIGELCFIGVGSSIIPSLSIGQNSTLGAGSVVITDIAENSLAYGIPAKVVN
ncbi:acetyltransferase [Alteromonadaceae bacterium BrNp21-10]|nr:acetyltransferase [Alteromonadaceae bacterium BrNp21-10]